MHFVAAVTEELGDLQGIAVGVGPVSAAVATARWLAEVRPKAVVLVGTAGAYEGGPAVGTVVAGRRIAHGDAAASAGLAYVPRPPPPLDSDPGLLAALGLTEVDVVGVAAITTDLPAAKALSVGGSVEHMEAYGFAAACHGAGVPFAVVLGIANAVGPDAHAQWRGNRASAEAAARNAARRVIA